MRRNASEPLTPCPHCQGTDFKIVHRDCFNDGGMVLTCQNGDCIARIWGHDETDVVARWNRRSPGPETKAMLAWAEETLKDLEDRDPEFNRSENYNPWLLMLQAFIDEWKPSAEK